MAKVQYRNCEQLIDKLKIDAFGKLLIKVVNADDELFLGIRHKALNIYICGASIAKIYVKRGKIVAYLNESFILGKQAESCRTISLSDLVVRFGLIKTNAVKIYCEQSKYEKICQQWIVNRTNHDPDNEWYCVDMEYNTQGKRLGRFDIIAVSRMKDENTKKHKVCLIELKVGEDSFGGSWSDKILVHGKEYDQVSKDGSVLFHPDYEELGFGSGVVGHIADYLRFLGNPVYYDQLRENIVQMLKCQSESGVINVPQIMNIDEIDEKPEILIACYDGFNMSALPKGYSCSASVKAWPDVEELKRKMKTVLFSSGTHGINYTSKYNLQDALDHSYIDEFLKLKIVPAINDYEVNQAIKGQRYKFRIKFIDQSAPGSWNCLK